MYFLSSHQNSLLSIILIFFSFLSYSQPYHLDVEGHLKIRGNIDILDAGGLFSIFIGKDAGISNTTGSFNSFFGPSSGKSNTTGTDNSFYGQGAGKANTTGEANSFFGSNTGLKHANGYNNSFFGQAAGFNSRSGSNNVLLGEFSGGNQVSGSNNTYVGARADQVTTDPLDRAIAIGYLAKVACSQCAVIGGVGVNAVKVGVGVDDPKTKLHLKQTGNGPDNGIRLERSNDNNYWNITNWSDNDLVFRHSNEVDDITSYINWEDGTFVNSSDRRLKKNIKPLESILERVLNLNAKQYQFKGSAENNLNSIGFIAQEVEKLFPETVMEKAGYKGLVYDHFGIYAIKAIQEQQVIINALEERVKDTEVLKELLKQQQVMIQSQQDQIDALQSIVNKIVAN